MLKNTNKAQPLSIIPAPQDAPWWRPRHEQKLAEKNAMQGVDLVFLGDSITQGWEDAGYAVWDNYYRPLNALNLGFNGDRTEHVLWRLAHGAVDDISPKLVVLLIGTNNTGHRQDPPQETVMGIQQILQVLLAKLPDCQILLLAVFPRSAKPTQKLRVMNDEINALLVPHGLHERVHYLDIKDRFVDSHGVVSADVMGIQQILQVLLAKLPDCQILLLAVFPRSAKPTQRLRVMNDEINALLVPHGLHERVHYLDIKDRFVDSHGVVSADVMEDFLHLNPDQYAVWADAIAPDIKRLMAEPEPV